MKLTTVKEIYKEREKYLDKEVTVGGWVRSVRDSKTFGFIVLHDGSFFETLQVVYHCLREAGGYSKHSVYRCIRHSHEQIFQFRGKSFCNYL